MITASLLRRAQTDKDVAKSIASKRAFNLKQLLVNTWRTFAKDNSLTSKETCIFGGHVLRQLTASINMMKMQKSLTGEEDTWLLEDCFIGEEGDIDIFFKDSDDRQTFIKRLRHVFDMKDATPPPHYNTDTLPVDLIRYRLGSNLKEPDVPFVYIDLVCKNGPLVPYCDVKNLQMGPEKNDIFQAFEHSHSPYPTLTDSVTRTVKLGRTIHNIEKKCTKLYILSLHEYQGLYPNMNKKDYENYWRGILHRGERMLDQGWIFSNFFHSDMCDCHNNFEWRYVSFPTEIVRVCSKCKKSFAIYNID